MYAAQFIFGAYAATVLAFLAAGLVASVVHADSNLSYVFLVCLVGGYPFAVFAPTKWMNSQIERFAHVFKARSEDLCLIEKEDDPETALAQLRYILRGRTVGVDRGIIWVEDGTLRFHGHGTGFVFQGSDLRRVTNDRGIYLGWEEVEFNSIEGDVRCVINPVVQINSGSFPRFSGREQFNRVMMNMREIILASTWPTSAIHGLE